MDKLNIYGNIDSTYDLMNHTKIIKKEENIEDVEDILNNPYLVFCLKIPKKISISKNGFINNDLNIDYFQFPWRIYYEINKELVSKNEKNNTKINAWNHWLHNGIKEERAFSYINNTNDHRARFGNLFFLNMCLHLFSLKFNLKSNYKNESMFHKLGIDFFKGTEIYKKNLLLTDCNYLNLLKSDVSPKNIILNNNVWFQSNEFCKIIEKYFIENKIFENVKDKNNFKNRYKNNNDLFIHIRLGDVEDKTQQIFSYYENTIKLLKFNKGYISSDNINHTYCIDLIQKYNLEIINKNEVETIMFASTCKQLILSGGTFSWLIGFLAVDAKHIFYPEMKDKWFGDIFSYSNWIKKV